MGRSVEDIARSLQNILSHVGDCQNYGPFLGPYYNTGPNTGPNLGDPKRDHNFDNLPLLPMLLNEAQRGSGPSFFALHKLRGTFVPCND